MGKWQPQASDGPATSHTDSGKNGKCCSPVEEQAVKTHGGCLEGAASKPSSDGRAAPDALHGSPVAVNESAIDCAADGISEDDLLGYIKVTRESRMGRQARIDEAESRKIHVFGVPASLSLRGFAKRLSTQDLLGLEAFASLSREGKDDASEARVVITCKTQQERDGAYQALRPVLPALGWKGYRGREWLLRVAQRDGQQFVPKVHRVVGQTKLVFGSSKVALETANPFIALSALAPVAGSDVPVAGSCPKSKEAEMAESCVALATWNAQHLSDLKLQVFGKHCLSLGVEIAAIQEIKWPIGKNSPSTSGYRFLGAPHAREGHSGGVGFLVGLLCSKSIQDLGSKHENQYWISVRVDGGSDLYLCCVYMPQAKDSVRAKAAFTALRDSVNEYSAFGTVVVLGDLNAHVARADGGARMGEFGELGETCANGRLLLNFLDSTDLVAANCRVARDGAVDFTRVDKKSKRESVLDYVLVPSSSLRGSAVVDRTDLSSNHSLVTYSLPGMATKRSKAPATRTVWDVSKLRGSGDKVAASRACLAESFAESLSSFGNYLVSSKRDEVGVDAVCAEWCSRVEKGARESGVSKLKKVHRTFSKNWFDAELQAKVSQRQEAWKKACETLTDADLREYFSLRADGRKMAKAKKRQSWDELMDKLSNEFKAHNKLFFSTLNRSAGKRGNADIGPIRDGDGVLRFEETEKREAIAAFYEKLGQPVLESKLIDGGTVVDGKVVHSRYDDEFLAKVTKNVILYARLSNDQEDTEADCPIVASEVASVLKDLKLGAPGGDKLPPDFLKFGGEAMLDSLCSLFNYVLDRSVIPESWGKALVVLLFKDGSREDPGNYRGISLLDIVGKVFAKVCARRLEKQVSMAREQAGFTAGRGCEYNLYVLLQVLQRRKFEGKDTFLFFLDVRKAFDTVWRDGLLEKLWGLGVKGKLWRAFRAMYAKNKSAILVNGVPTRWFDILQGTRQGATESPLLFKIFIDGLVEELAKLKLGIEIDVGKLLDGLLFADDIVLAAASREDLQKMIGVVEAYSRKWRFEENLA